MLKTTTGWMLSITLLFFVVMSDTSAFAESPANDLTKVDKLGGWQLLFDGKSTNGWRNYQGTGVSDGWIVKDGALTRAEKGAGDLVTEKEYKYFELQLEYKIYEGGNSGVLFHVTEQGKKPWHSGPEIQIQDNEKGSDAQKAGWLYQLYQPVKPGWAKRFEQQVGFSSPDVDDATRPAGEWNFLYLRVAPDQCEVIVNGVSYYYFQIGNGDWNRRVAASKFAKFPEFGKAGSGHICLQDHNSIVSFRNIKLRELSDRGTVPDPVDGKLPVKGEVAFPNLVWEGWSPTDERGRIVGMRPMILTHAGDGSRRIFVATQEGVIYVFDGKPDAKESERFLDLSEKVHHWKQDDEEGLLGFAFHPNYKDNGQFYLYYSSEAEPRTSIVSRFTVSKDDPNRADPASEQIVMKIPEPFSNHNGGSIVFGNDGMLYIGLGDGGGRNDPMHQAQDLSTWMGSVLRIDVDHHDQGKNYAIPKDNPFVDQDGALPEIYAYGFRNPWRLSVDRPTGRIWLADVGQDLWEEINVVQAGGNYGWSVREASLPFGNVDAANPSSLVDPVWVYDHRIGKSITGGMIYHGTKFPELQGKYVYADYVSGKIWALEFDGDSAKPKSNYSISDGGIPVISFGEDEAGEIYYMITTNSGQGIYRFAYAK